MLPVVWDLKFKMLIIIKQSQPWIRGAMVARLTPDQKVACSIHVGFNSHFFSSIIFSDL